MNSAATAGLVLAALIWAGPAQAQTPPCGAPPSGLVHHWSGDDTTADSAGGNDGTVVGTVAYGPGVCGRAFVFTGAGSVSVPNAASLRLGPSFTIAAWVRIDQLQWGSPIVSHGDDGAAGWYLWHDGSGNSYAQHLKFGVNGLYYPASPIHTPWRPTVGRWYHVAAVRNGDTYGLFVNGAQVAAVTDSSPILDVSNSLRIGGQVGSTDLIGAVDEVQIFDRALASSEVQAMFAAAPAGTVSPPALETTRTSVSGLLACAMPCSISPQAVVRADSLVTAINEGTVRFRSFDGAGIQLGEWSAPVVNGVATFQNVMPSPGTLPRAVSLTADFIPATSAFLESSWSQALSVTPPVEARIPIQTINPLAVDELTNRVYASHSTNPVIQVFDGTTNEVLTPIPVQFGATAPEGGLGGLGIDTQRRRLYVVGRAPEEWSLWVIDLDQHVVTGVIALPGMAAAEKAADHPRVNPNTGKVYLGARDGLVTVDPAAPAGAQVSFTPYGVSVVGAAFSFVPVINPSTNVIYSGGTLFDGSGDTTPLGLGYDLRAGFHYYIANTVGLNRRTSTLFVPVTDYSAPRCDDCRRWGVEGVPEAIKILNGVKGTAGFNTEQAKVAFSPRFGADAYGWYAASMEVNSTAERVYVAYAVNSVVDSGLPGSPFNAPGYDFSGPWIEPITVLDARTGARISEWWNPLNWNCYDATFGLSLTVNPVNGRLYSTTCDNIVVYRDVVTEQEPTSAGSNVAVTVPAAEITFATVTQAGETTVESVSAASLDVALPGQFSLTGALAYEVSTTASISGPITLCFDVSSITDETAFNQLSVLHGENGVWVDRTVSRDFSARTICATTASLSPFAVARRNPYAVNPLYDATKAFKAGSTVPVKIQVFEPTGMNVSSSQLRVQAVDVVRRSTSAASTMNDSGSANPELTFRYDAGLAGYIFNLSTKGLTTGTYDVRFKIGADGRLYSTTIQLR